MLNIYVFSYNRPQFLENCLSSIQRHAPGAGVHVLDDNSVDPGVAEVLDKWMRKRSVKVIPPGMTTLGLHGGLYNNMQRAFDHGLDSGADIGLFIQDDMQLVREITPQDIAVARNYFSLTPNALEMNVLFFKEMYRENNNGSYSLDTSLNIYHSKDWGRTAPACFCDVGIFHFGRMKELSWSFEQGEGENDEKAQKYSLTMGCYAFPFMMNLPFPKTEYYRSKLLLLRAFEWWVGAGFFPYDPMAPSDVTRLFQRDLAKLPEAEQFLRPRGLNRPGPWIFGGAVIGVIELGGIRGRIAGLAGRTIKTVLNAGC